MITAVKEKRKLEDRLKKDFTPTELDLGNLKVFLARHFGFCYGVENAVETAYQIIADITKDYDFPVTYDFPAGHIHDNRTLILGKKVRLDVNDKNTVLKFE